MGGALGRMTHGALDLFAVMAWADQQDLVVVAAKTHGPRCTFRHQRAGGAMASSLRSAAARLSPPARDAVRGEAADVGASGTSSTSLTRWRSPSSPGSRPHGCCARSVCARRPVLRSASRASSPLVRPPGTPLHSSRAGPRLPPSPPPVTGLSRNPSQVPREPGRHIHARLTAPPLV
jgi:hypothetical protein